MAKVPLLHLPKLLAERFDEPIPSYSAMYTRAASGILPGMSFEFGRRLVDDDYVVEIGLALGLTLKAKARRVRNAVA